MAPDTRRAAKDAVFDAFGSIAGALSSGRRAEIIELLAQGERSVEQVADAIGQSVANTSHHLRTLARAGLVETRRTGTHVRYRLASDQVAQVWLSIRRLATEQVGGFDELARAYLGERGELETITRAELVERLGSDDVVLIDVRPAAEYAAGHLPGAISTPPELLEGLLDSLPAGGDVVAYCRGPYCVFADDAVRLLRERGRRALRLEDGLPEWRLAGGALER